MLVAANARPGHVALTDMVKEAHRQHLVVHPYTVPRDQLPDYVTNVNQLFDLLYNKAGVDGLFSDFPDKAVQFLQQEGNAANPRREWQTCPRRSARMGCCQAATSRFRYRFLPGSSRAKSLPAE
nr:glycerophosphoryl diester phosphodiesterase [Raoultella sp. NCTC 9187]